MKSKKLDSESSRPLPITDEQVMTLFKSLKLDVKEFGSHYESPGYKEICLYLGDQLLTSVTFN